MRRPRRCPFLVFCAQRVSLQDRQFFFFGRGITCPLAFRFIPGLGGEEVQVTHGARENGMSHGLAEYCAMEEVCLA